MHWVTGVNGSTIEQLPALVMKPDSMEPLTMEIIEGKPLVKTSFITTILT
ncbi:hypothetical protein ACFVAD_11675 [Sutcliffiella sp. NPDC057660]